MDRHYLSIYSHGPLNIETAIDFIKQILNGVKQAHEQRIIHRDIKPQNVLINKDKILKFLISASQKR